jgi:hypothetical protein
MNKNDSNNDFSNIINPSTGFNTGFTNINVDNKETIKIITENDNINETNI